MRRFEPFTSEELTMLQRHAIESSLAILQRSRYIANELTLHIEPVNEINAEVKYRESDYDMRVEL